MKKLLICLLLLMLSLSLILCSSNIINTERIEGYIYWNAGSIDDEGKVIKININDQDHFCVTPESQNFKENNNNEIESIFLLLENIGDEYQVNASMCVKTSKSNYYFSESTWYWFLEIGDTIEYIYNQENEIIGIKFINDTEIYTIEENGNIPSGEYQIYKDSYFIWK